MFITFQFHFNLLFFGFFHCFLLCSRNTVLGVIIRNPLYSVLLNNSSVNEIQVTSKKMFQILNTADLYSIPLLNIAHL